MLSILVGYRTYIVSAIAGICAILLQLDADTAINLAPAMEMFLTLIMYLMLPLVPVFMRKAIEKMQNDL